MRRAVLRNTAFAALTCLGALIAAQANAAESPSYTAFSQGRYLTALTFGERNSIC